MRTFYTFTPFVKQTNFTKYMFRRISEHNAGVGILHPLTISEFVKDLGMNFSWNKETGSIEIMQGSETILKLQQMNILGEFPITPNAKIS